MDLFEALARRRSRRVYADEPVAPALVERILYAAKRAPTASNVPYRRLLIVDDPRLIRAVRLVSPSLLADAPLLLVIFTDLAMAVERVGRIAASVSLLDSGAAGENVLLAATALGLGSQFTTVSTQVGIRRVLGLPEQCRVDLVIPLGHPATEEAGTATRTATAEVFHNAYGRSYRARPGG